MDVCISELQKKVAQFVKERSWEKFHTPKDVSLAIAVEVAELLEIFQWKTNKEVKKLLKKPHFQKRIQEEIADILIYVMVLSNTLDINLSQVVLQKIKTNKVRYPANKVKGKATKYTEL
jgi:NTP pyrophosphatase (non-canonical NTP hydrolase)